MKEGLLANQIQQMSLVEMFEVLLESHFGELVDGFDTFTASEGVHDGAEGALVDRGVDEIDDCLAEDLGITAARADQGFLELGRACFLQFAERTVGVDDALVAALDGVGVEFGGEGAGFHDEDLHAELGDFEAQRLGLGLEGELGGLVDTDEGDDLATNHRGDVDDGAGLVLADARQDGAGDAVGTNDVDVEILQIFLGGGGFEDAGHAVACVVDDNVDASTQQFGGLSDPSVSYTHLTLPTIA